MLPVCIPYLFGKKPCFNSCCSQIVANIYCGFNGNKTNIATMLTFNGVLLAFLSLR